MKKTVSVICAAAMLLSLMSGCAEKNTNEPPATKNTPTENLTEFE